MAELTGDEERELRQQIQADARAALIAALDGLEPVECAKIMVVAIDSSSACSSLLTVRTRWRTSHR
jgi:hypothetical protein